MEKEASYLVNAFPFSSIKTLRTNANNMVQVCLVSAVVPAKKKSVYKIQPIITKQEQKRSVDQELRGKKLILTGKKF